MNLSELVKELEITNTFEGSEREISGICFDSRNEIPKNGVFVCIKGAKSDGHDFALQAEEAGAAAIVAEHEIELKGKAVLIVTPDTRKALSVLSAAWFGYPARSLNTIGITGTKGKSTTAYMIRNILTEAGHKVGIIGTIGIGIGDKVYPTGNTTPQSYVVQQYFRQMVDEGCDSVVMEVSSQGLKQSRVFGVEFDVAAFTNLEPDHIGENEHASFEEYAYCKSLLFKQCKKAVINCDDAHAEYMVEGSSAEVLRFGMKKDTQNSTDGVFADSISLLSDNGNYGIAYELCGKLSGSIKLSIPGRFNIYNSLCAIAVCMNFTKNMTAIKTALFDTKVLGRLEPVNISKDFGLMIDYAHNAMALKSLLSTLREYKPGRLICLFGCGGNRSRDRRFEMGEVSSRMADLSVITSDNPRYEKPEDIIEDILTGVRKADGKYIMIPDRREAIRYCIENAMPGDLIVLAGKGNEDYQEICGVKHHMDEREIIADIVSGKV